MNIIVRIGGGAAIATALLVACSSSNDAPPEDPAGSCDAIASACHPYDKISTVGHECHELGHAGVDTSCGPRRAECLAACPPREAGAHEDAAKSDGAPSDASGDANDSICASYCQCLTDTCSSQAGYPFASPAACLTKCASSSAAEKACWPGFCEQAKTEADKTHSCEHAWGKLGLDECP